MLYWVLSQKNSNKVQRKFLEVIDIYGTNKGTSMIDLIYCVGKCPGSRGKEDTKTGTGSVLELSVQGSECREAEVARINRDE